MSRYLLPILAAAGTVIAKTDLEGCTSFTSTVTVNPSPGYGNTYESIVWYVPDSLEICEGVDCGGGRAPPRKVPGCPLYSGTETVTAKFLPTDPAAKPAVTPTTRTVTPTGSISFAYTGTWTGAEESEETGVAHYTGTWTGAEESEETGVAHYSGTWTGKSTETGAYTWSGTLPTSSGATVITDSAPAASTTAVQAGAGPAARVGAAAALGAAAAAALL